MNSFNPSKDGGAAFPQSADNENGVSDCGMSMRDYFAAAAMTGELAMMSSKAEFDSWISKSSVDGLDPKLFLARRCYEIADAMIKARRQS